jgi:hypothetical protein
MQIDGFQLEADYEEQADIIIDVLGRKDFARKLYRTV